LDSRLLLPTSHRRAGVIVIHANEVKGYWSPPPHHRELKVLLSPAIQDVVTGLSIGMVSLPPGESGDVHSHQEEQETWYILSGSGRLTVGAEEVDLGPGTLVVAPPGVEHQIANPGGEPLNALFMYSPAGPEQAFLPDRALSQ
jgi:mannose-6-phosphate isomerase-like protein (cupin superfamily)